MKRDKELTRISPAPTASLLQLPWESDLPMSIKMLIMSFLLALTLAACSQASPVSTMEFKATPTTAPAPVAAPREPGCSVVTRRASPAPTQQSPIPAVGLNDWVLGSPEAALTIIEYSDFQCPGCAYVAPVLEQLNEKYPEKVRIVFRHYPLIVVYDKAALAAQAAEAAGLQERFWELHDLLFSRQVEWAGKSPEEFKTWLVQRAKDLKLNTEQFEKDLNSPALVNRVQHAYEQNYALRMPGVPYLLINGEPYSGPLTLGDLEAVVGLTLLEERQFDDCPPMTIDPSKQYLAVLHTEKGDITLDLFADKAPLAVNNFVFLARKGWYDGVTFHRVLPGFMAQTGDPTGTGYGGPGYAFDNEITDLKFDSPGVLGMANAGPGSNGSQFFITYAAAPHLNGGFTIFGRLVSGMDVLQKLTPRDPSQPVDLPPGDKIVGVTIIEK
jgi:cyclophilin family peptidyl-prolyl cis-trans isomerase/protein-disulfide isomerase